MVDQVDKVGGVTGRPARVWQRSLVEQHDVPPTEAPEVIRNAVAHDAAADDHAPRGGGKSRHRYSGWYGDRVSSGSSYHWTRSPTCARSFHLSGFGCASTVRPSSRSTSSSSMVARSFSVLTCRVR